MKEQDAVSFGWTRDSATRTWGAGDGRHLRAQVLKELLSLGAWATAGLGEEEPRDVARKRARCGRERDCEGEGDPVRRCGRERENEGKWGFGRR